MPVPDCQVKICKIGSYGMTTFFDPRGGSNIFLCLGSLLLLIQGVDASAEVWNGNSNAQQLPDPSLQTITGAECTMQRDAFMSPGSPIQHHQGYKMRTIFIFSRRGSEPIIQIFRRFTYAGPTAFGRFLNNLLLAFIKQNIMNKMFIDPHA